MDSVINLLDFTYMMENKKRIIDKYSINESLINVNIAVLCGSTFGDIKEFLNVFLLCNGIKANFYVGNYNRYYEEACFENNELKEFNPDIILIHTTNRNLTVSNSESVDDTIKNYSDKLVLIWDSLKKYEAVIIQNNFEYFPYRIVGNYARISEDGNIRLVDEINSFINCAVKENKNLYLNDIHYLSSYVGLENWYDEKIWNLYKYPMKLCYSPRYALNIASIIKSIYGKNKKLIVTDLDNTLWGGVIGEVGVSNIKLGNETAKGEAYLSLHRYLKTLENNGIILCIASKNDYETAIAGLNSEKSLLKEKDFVIKKINWNNKAQNIAEIINEINMTSESIVFIDDNIIECDSVNELLDGVSVIHMKQPTDFIQKFDQLSLFEMISLTSEDRIRSHDYQNNIKRNLQKSKFNNYDEYLKSLDMICYVDDINNNNIERVVQLLNKTNQFNFMTNRYSMEQIINIKDDLDYKAIVLTLEDKFGTNGIVSISIVKIEDEAIVITDWIMSCRVFERGLEYAMLDEIVKIAKKCKVNKIIGYYKETEKNGKIKDFYKQQHFEYAGYDEQRNIHKWVNDKLEVTSETQKFWGTVLYS